MKPTSAPRSLLRLAGLAAVLSLGAAGYAQQAAAPPQDDGPDPALANMAPADSAAAQQGLTPSAQQDFSGPPPMQQAPAPIVRSAPMVPAQNGAAQYGTAQPGQPDDSYNAPIAGDNAGGDPNADAQVAAGQQALDDADLTADQAPPDLPDYTQPDAPADNYMWTPGYWGYGGVGYYWIPGAWIVPPYYGALWTPGYWGEYGAKYRFHPGYWGPHVGYYGGINYGFGYIGVGYFGGYWRGNAFVYNRAVTHVGARVSVTNVYSRTVVYNHQTFTAQPTVRTSYNGGRGGINVAPRPAELSAMRENHTGALPGQVALRNSAGQNSQAAFSNNHGHPPVAAQQQPLGTNREIANNPAAFQQRENLQQRPAIQQNRQMQQQRPAQQARPQMQQPRPAPAPRASAPAPHASSGGGKH